MVTVDVEAQPGRSNGDRLARLVWGRFPEGGFGIPEMMDIAEKQGARLTMFLDYAEESMYGEALLDVGREIHRRGHDLQLHIHQGFLPNSFYESRGIARVVDLNLTEPEAADRIVDFLSDAHSRAGGEPARAFRGGGYRYNNALLDALARQGVRIDSSYNPSRATQPLNLGQKKQFRWQSGIYEVPISTVSDFMGTRRVFDYNFNAGLFLRCSVEDSVQRHLEFLDKFHARHGEDAIAVLVMHSWSFLRLDNEGLFSIPVPDAAERLGLLLERLRPTTEIVTSAEVLELLDGGKVGIENEVAFRYEPVASEPSAPPAAAERNEPMPVSPGEPVCSICGTPQREFRDADTKGRHCVCGSLERQRVFADLYSSEGFDLAGMRVFAVAPSVVELRLFTEYGVGELTKVDIRPEVKPDLVADICNMPQVPDASYDVVFASFVLTCVYDMDRALSEFARVLRPGGRLYSTDPVVVGRPTEEFTDPARITSWYGPDALEKYRVGSFRRLGDEDTKAALGRYFDVEAFAGIDSPTKMPVVWHVGTRLAREPVAPHGAVEHGRSDGP